MKKDLSTIIKSSNSRNEILIKYFGYANKSSYDKLNKFIVDGNIDISHLNKKLNYCLNCGKNVANRNKFCSSSCAATFNNKKRIVSDKTKKMISDKLKNRKLTNKQINSISGDKNGRWKGGKSVLNKESERVCVHCNKNFIAGLISNGRLSRSKFCSNTCKNKSSSENLKQKGRDGLLAGWTTRNIISYPEQFFIKVLNNNNIEFIHNYPVNKKDLGINDPYNYFLDFYIKDKNIDLEIDGNQHKDRKEHDMIRDKSLTENGYIVYRINWKNINTERGKEYIKEEINKFLEFYKNL